MLAQGTYLESALFPSVRLGGWVCLVAGLLVLW
jgi:hypothetical protein